MSVFVKKNQSRLRHADLIQIGEVEFWDRPRIPEIETSSEDTIHIVSENERIDTIASKYYGDQNLWWVIAHANDMRILPIELTMGTELIVPDVRKLRRDVLI